MNFPYCEELGLTIKDVQGYMVVDRTQLVRELTEASKTDPGLPERFHECFGERTQIAEGLFADDVEECLRKTLA